MAIDPFSLAQVLGYVGLVTYVLCYLPRNDKHMKLGFSFSNIFWVAHYWFMNAHTAALTTSIMALRNLLSLNSDSYSNRKNHLYAFAFTLSLMIAATLTWGGLPSFVSVCACIVVTQAIFFLKGIQLRQMFFLGDMGWLAHAILVNSIGGLIYAVVSLTFNAFTIYTMMRDERIAKNVAGEL